MASYVAFISGIVKFSSPSFSWALLEKNFFHFFLLSYHCFTKRLQFSFETLHDGGDSFSIFYEFLGVNLCSSCSSFLQQNLLQRCSSLVDFSSFFFSWLNSSWMSCFHKDGVGRSQGICISSWRCLIRQVCVIEAADLSPAELTKSGSCFPWSPSLLPLLARQRFARSFM